MLLGIAIVLVAASLVGALLLVSRAPAVSRALIGGVAGGLCGFYFSSRHDPKAFRPTSQSGRHAASSRSA